MGAVTPARSAPRRRAPSARQRPGEHDRHGQDRRFRARARPARGRPNSIPASMALASPAGIRSTGRPNGRTSPASTMSSPPTGRRRPPRDSRPRRAPVAIISANPGVDQTMLMGLRVVTLEHQLRTPCRTQMTSSPDAAWAGGPRAGRSPQHDRKAAGEADDRREDPGRHRLHPAAARRRWAAVGGVGGRASAGAETEDMADTGGEEGRHPLGVAPPLGKAPSLGCGVRTQPPGSAPRPGRLRRCASKSGRGRSFRGRDALRRRSGSASTHPTNVSDGVLWAYVTARL